MNGTNFLAVSACRACYCRGPRPRDFLRRRKNAVGRQQGRHRVDVRDRARRARACDRRRAWRLGDHSCKRRTLHRAEIRRRDLFDLAWHQDVSRGPSLLPEQIAPVSTKRAFRDGVLVEALNPEDGGLLSGLHSAVPRSGRQLPGPPVHDTRPDLGRAQYVGRFRRGADGIDGAFGSRAPAAAVSTPATGLGAVHRRARRFAGAGAPA